MREAEGRMFSLSHDTEHVFICAIFELILEACGMEQLLAEPLSEPIWTLLSPADVVKLRTGAKERNKGSKYRPHGELFFFFSLMEQDPYEKSGETTSTSCEKYDTRRS